MLLSNVFHTKVVDNKREQNWPCYVFPQARCVGTFVVAVGEETFSKEFAEDPRWLVASPGK